MTIPSTIMARITVAMAVLLLDQETGTYDSLQDHCWFTAALFGKSDQLELVVLLCLVRKMGVKISLYDVIMLCKLVFGHYENRH